MIVDTHTHWGIVWEDKYGTDPSAWLEVLDSHGIEKAVLMGHRSLTRNADIKQSNDIVYEATQRSNGRLIPLATVHPDFGEESVVELERCLTDLGMRGAKFHPWLQGMSMSHPVMDDLVSLCGEKDVPVIFHDGTPCYSMSSQVGGLALRFPDTTFVLGHAGLLECWRSAISYMNRSDNLWCTLCGPYLGAIQAILDNVDNSRIMWGSDFGFGWADPIDYRLNLLNYAEMSDESRGMVMGGNAIRLFGIER